MIEQGKHIRVPVKDTVKGTWLNHFFKPAQVYTAAVVQCGVAFNGFGITIFGNPKLSFTYWKNAAFWLSYSSSSFFCGLLFFWHWLAPLLVVLVMAPPAIRH